MEIKEKKGCENVVADHLSRLVNEEVTSKEAEVRDEFPDESLFVVSERPWFADMANFKAVGMPTKIGNLIHQNVTKKLIYYG